MPRHATKTSYKSGEQHIDWKGGTTDYWRRIARKITNCPKGYVVHHIDHNVENNNLGNLMMMTQSEHMKLHNRIDKLFQKALEKKGKPVREKFRKDIVQLTKLGLPSRFIAKLLGIGKTTVLRARGDIKSKIALFN